MRVPIQAVLFDAVGTLIRPRPAVADAYGAVGRRFGSGQPADEVRRRFSAAFARQEAIDRDADWRTSEPRERQRWRAIVDEVFDEVSDRDALFDALWEHFADDEHWEVYPDVPAALDELQSAGLPLAMASNFDARLQRVVAAKASLAPIGDVYVSSRLGFRKPDVRFYRAIERRVGLAADALLFVGDDRENDFNAARRAGWQALLIDRRGDPSDAQTLTSLADLYGRVIDG